VVYDLTTEPIDGNADSAPLNSTTFLSTSQFVESPAGIHVTLIARFYGTRDSNGANFRRIIAILPLESQLVEGATLEVGFNKPISIYLNDNTQISFPNRSWYPFNGTATVTSWSGRVAKLRIDASGEPLNEATGKCRIQGTVTLDYAQPIDPTKS